MYKICIKGVYLYNKRELTRLIKKPLMKKSIKKAVVSINNEHYNLQLGRKAIIKKDSFYNGESHYVGIWEDDKTKFEAPSIFFEDLEEFANEMELLQIKTNEDNTKLYTYISKDLQSKISFQMHPKKAFAFAVLEAINIPKNMINDILDGFILKGIKQKEYQGGFEEAIMTIAF